MLTRSLAQLRDALLRVEQITYRKTGRSVAVALLRDPDAFFEAAIARTIWMFEHLRRALPARVPRG
jgi:hypothetical protein